MATASASKTTEQQLARQLDNLKLENERLKLEAEISNLEKHMTDRGLSQLSTPDLYTGSSRL